MLRDSAQKCFDTAVALFRKLGKDYPGVRRDDQLAEALRGRAGAFYRAGRKTEARADMQEARDILMKVLKRHNHFLVRVQLATLTIELGCDDVESGTVKGGVEKLGEGIDALRTLIKDGKAVVEIELAKALQMRARALGNDHQFESAIRDLEESARLFAKWIKQKGRKELQPHLDRTLRHLGEARAGMPLKDLQ
jgi:hypothetical protein